MKLRYVFLIAALCFVAGMVVSAVVIGGPLFVQLMEARAELALARAEAETAQDPLAEDMGGNAQVHILVARERFTQWSVIREPADMFDVQTTRKRMVPENAIVLEEPERIDTLKGRRFRATIERGHVLTQDDLLKKEVTCFDGGMLEKGKRAISIPISADRAIAFFVVPGSKVDVVHTVDGKSTVLLEDVLVLAIDLMATRDEDKLPKATATLQMDNTEQVLKLSAARDKGTLSLVMRAPGGDDDKNPPVKPPPPPVEDKKK